MKDHSKLWISIGIILCGLLYGFVLFAIKKDLSLAEWILFGFTVFSLFVLLIWVCVKGGNIKQYPMIDFPVTIVILLYTGCQLVLGGIIGMILPLPNAYAVLTIEIIVLIFFIIIVVILNSNMSSVRRIDEDDYENVSRIREYTASARAIRNLLANSELAAKADQMVEVLEYADPSHIMESKVYEDRIDNNLRILREDIEANDFSTVSDRMDQIVNIVRERADVIRAYKK